MSFNEFATYNEIKSQTAAWEQALSLAGKISLPLAEDYDQVIFTGCGSTYYLSMAAAALYQGLTGRPARAVPGGELLLNPQIVVPAARLCLLVAISRSGTTTETVKAVEKFQASKSGDVLVISNYDEILSKMVECSIVIPRGQEESVAQTRSFASMVVAASALCVRMANRVDLLDSMSSLPRIGDHLLNEYEPAARRIGEDLDFDRFYFLGSGAHYGLACEANLKMKEMSLTHSEAFHFLEFRHGPMSMVNDRAVVIGLVSESNYKHETAVLHEMQTLGGETMALGETGVEIAFESALPESLRGVLYLPVLQLLAFYRSVKKGLNPDRPKNLSAVIKLDL
jgi:glutamine---fructose-6-phosphate transaminase (isomerizing)